MHVGACTHTHTYIHTHSIQDVISEGTIDETVNVLYGVFRRAGREMEIRTTKFKIFVGMTINVEERREKLKWQ
jgi:hypothetical protein